ncbi:MAG: hypothetical protein JWN10_2051 [Solirubrobacterales bacterium]|nr:hypothetical protein [Solirubrobacterales bacterium]
MSETAVYRVRFHGDEPSDAAGAALAAAEVVWEGSALGSEQPSRHRVLVYARSEREAEELVRPLLASHGSSEDFRAEVAKDAKGHAWRGGFYRGFEEVDWDARPERAALTPLERGVLEELLQAHEPAWTIVRWGEVDADRERVEASLQCLQARGLVWSEMAQSGETGRETELVRWWALSDEAWDLLGFIKSPAYR